MSHCFDIEAVRELNTHQDLRQLGGMTSVPATSCHRRRRISQLSFAMILVETYVQSTFEDGTETGLERMADKAVRRAAHYGYDLRREPCGLCRTRQLLPREALVTILCVGQSSQRLVRVERVDERAT